MENKPIQHPQSRIQNSFHGSVFWKVAGILVGVQVVTGLMAVALGAWFANDRSRDLAANSLRLRLDGLAEEVEQRADSSLLESGLAGLPSPVRFDLSRRFRDPVLLLDVNGTVVDTIQPDDDGIVVVETQNHIEDCGTIGDDELRPCENRSAGCRDHRLDQVFDTAAGLVTDPEISGVPSAVFKISCYPGLTDPRVAGVGEILSVTAEVDDDCLGRCDTDS